MTEPSLPWLAGFIDGEGTLNIVQKDNHYYPRISVTNTHFPTKQFVINILNENNLLFYEAPDKPEKIRPNGVLYKMSWELSIQNDKCLNWLLLLVPYLKTKQQQGYLLLDFIESRKNKARGSRYSFEELSIIEKIMALNNTKKSSQVYQSVKKLKEQLVTKNAGNLLSGSI